MKKNKKEEQYNNGQLGLIFAIVSGLVYGSCFIVKDHVPTVTETIKDNSEVFMGRPEF